MTRLFVALDLPGPIIAALAEAAPIPGRGVRLVRPEQMHLTLHFIGDANADAVTRVLEPLENEPCRLSVSGVGCFRLNGGRAILWAGVSETPELLALHKACAVALESIGIKTERRRFAPHVTLARLAPGVAKSTLEAFLDADRTQAFGSFLADEYVLYDSVTTDRGAKYEVVAAFPMHRADRETEAK